LLRALTHDVRSPLNIILMNADLLARSNADSDVVRRALVIRRSVASIERGWCLLSHTLTFSRSAMVARCRHDPRVQGCAHHSHRVEYQPVAQICSDPSLPQTSQTSPLRAIATSIRSRYSGRRSFT
jgi:hypothetical protein